MRVKGTESEKLVKEGRLKLDPAKPMERKSIMNQKLLQPSKEPLPPIQPKETTKKEISAKNTGQAFEVVFDENSDQLKTKKYSKFSSIRKKRDIRLASEKIDER